MENASEALIMAFGFMIFVLALSISISLFGQARSTSEYIFDLLDRENDYMYVENLTNEVNRTVSVENIIPTMYRAYKENYKIVFLNVDGTAFPIYNSIAGQPTNPVIPINTLDLEQENERNEKWIGSHANIVKFLDSLISGEGDGYITVGSENVQFYQEITGLGNGLYEALQGRTITEHLGEYYQEDLEYVEGVSEEKLEVNKTKKRIITYVIH